MATNDEELNDFLERVDEISDIVSKLNAKDETIRNDAIRRADLKLNEDKIKYDRTVINYDAFKDLPSKKDYSQNDNTLPPCLFQTEQPSPDLFLKQIEADANERAKKRKENEKYVNELKEKGNAAYRDGSYSNAIDLYTQAIRLIGDYAILYTNRAQAYYKSQLYEKALKDCEAAEFLSKNNIKAELIKARVLLDTKKWNDAQISFERAMTLDPSRKIELLNYIKIIKDGQKLQEEEERVEELTRNGNNDLCVIKKCFEELRSGESYELSVNKISTLTSLINNSDKRILFRIEGGFEILEKYLSSVEEENKLWPILVDLGEAVVKENFENQKHLLQMSKFKDGLILSLNSDSNKEKLKCVNFLHTLSCDDFGRNLIVDTFDCNKLTQLLFIDKSNFSLSVLSNLALNESFRTEIEESFEQILLPKFHKVIESCVENDVTNYVSLYSNLAILKKYRIILATDLRFWDASIQCLQNVNEGAKQVTDVNVILGLILNLGKGGFPEATKPKMKSLLQELVLSLHNSQLAERACTAIHCVIKSFDGAVKTVLTLNLLDILHSILQLDNSSVTRPAILTLVALTNVSKKAQKETGNKNLTSLVKLLQSSDECIVGNAALCIVHCMKTQEISKRLEDTDIVNTLLNIIKKENVRADTKKNSAILLAKLASMSPEHLKRLRDLRGIEILQAYIPPPTS